MHTIGHWPYSAVRKFRTAKAKHRRATGAGAASLGRNKQLGGTCNELSDLGRRPGDVLSIYSDHRAVFEAAGMVTGLLLALNNDGYGR